tara:strand:+ start:531 stop:947 length:417 start_codon:yes stop_codon:yes gene_type:complete
MSNKKTKTVKMSTPEGMEFDTPYTMDHTLHNEHYWDTERNLDNFKKPSISLETTFAYQLDKVTEKITKLLKEKNIAYGNSALSPLNIFSKLGAVESLCCRLDDKIARISNKGINDQTEDTVDDLIGYLLLLKMAMERK